MEIIVGQITEYNEFRNQVVDMVKINAATVFDYDSDKGEKEARSYVYKLRQSKAAIDKKRKELGEDLVSRKKLIDGEAKLLIETVEGMIDVHMKPLEEKAAREAERVAVIEAYIKGIESYKQEAESSFPSERIKEAYEQLSVFDVSVLQERQQEGGVLQQSILQQLSIALDAAIAREAEESEAERQRIEQQAELEALRKAQAERDAKDADDKAEADRKANEERIANAAADKAKKDAEAEAQRKIDEANAAAQKAQADAKKAKQDIVDAENKRIADAKAQADADAKRAADIEHRKKINNAILTAFIETGVTEQQGKDIIKLIASGLVANIKITY